MPEISIIIPTRNRNNYLNRCLASLCYQSFNNFEVIVSDDGGTEKSDKIIQKYRNVLDVKYYWNKDKGGMSPAAARNFGLKKAKGKYILFIDSDIILPPKTIDKLYHWITRYSYRKERFYITPDRRIHLKKNIPLKIIKNNLKNINKYIEKDLDGNICKGDLSLSTVGLFQKRILDKIGGFDEILFTGRIYEDIELGARLLGFLDVKRKMLPLKIYHLNHYSDFKKRDIGARKILNETKELIKEKFIDLGFKYEKKYRPEKDLIKYSNKYYESILNNKSILDNVSKKLINSRK